MRRAPLQLGLGLAIGLALPAAAQTGGRHGHMPAAASAAHATHLPAGHLCPECAAALPRRVHAGSMTPEQASTMLVMGCADCGLPGSGATGLAHVGLGAEAPGYASVGLGSGPMAVASAEPMPIGVMRTSYANPAAMATRPAAPVYIPPPQTPMTRPGVDKGRMFGRMIGLPMPRLNSWNQAATARRREAHAAVRYDGLPGESGSLPASVVYGQGH